MLHDATNTAASAPRALWQACAACLIAGCILGANLAQALRISATARCVGDLSVCPAGFTFWRLSCQGPKILIAGVQARSLPSVNFSAQASDDVSALQVRQEEIPKERLERRDTASCHFCAQLRVPVQAPSNQSLSLQQWLRFPWYRLLAFKPFKLDKVFKSFASLCFEVFREASLGAKEPEPESHVH